MGRYTGITLTASKNEYIAYGEINNRMIGTLMREGNLYVSRNTYETISEDLIDLFGQGNVFTKLSTDSMGVIISVTINGKDHCKLIQERMNDAAMKKEEEEEQDYRCTDLDDLRERVLRERWL